MVSLFFHQLHLNREYLKEREKLHHFPPRKIIEVFDEFVENWLERGEYWKFLNSWWPRRNDPNTLWSRFEDLLADLPTEVKRVVDFLEWYD